MVNRGEEKVRVHMNVVPRSTGNTKKSFDLGGNRTHDLRIRSTVTLLTGLQKIFSLPRVVPCFPLLGLTPSGLFMGLSSTLIYSSELILCSTICVSSATRIHKSSRLWNFVESCFSKILFLDILYYSNFFFNCFSLETSLFYLLLFSFIIIAL